MLAAGHISRRIFSRFRSNATLANAMHAQNPNNIALIAPVQKLTWTYGDLSNYTGRLAGALSQMGYQKGDVIATDLASCAENYLLQLAASHLGLSVLTLKSVEDFEKLCSTLPVTPKGIACTGKDSFLAVAIDKLPLPALSVAPMPNARTMADEYSKRQGRPDAEQDPDAALGYYSSVKPITNAAAMECGMAAKEKLSMTGSDVVLVSITLNHLFGIGSAVSAALQSGAAVLLPDASGIVGCGSPSQRAQATLQFLGELKCTLMYADTHTLKALQEIGSERLPKLRGGICKVGSGTTFLEPTMEFAGAKLITIGKA